MGVVLRPRGAAIVTRPVSIVIPSLSDTELFRANLPALLDEILRRGEGDEVVVVDDTGEGVLEEFFAANFPSCRVLSPAENSGFARALTLGIEGASHELIFAMNPDVLVHSGFLDPLVAAMADQDVFACVPRVLLGGESEQIESVMELSLRSGQALIDQPGLEGRAAEFGVAEVPVAFAVGGTCLLRKSEFLAAGMDPLYEPFYWEDLDLCWSAWRAGKRVLYQPASVVEHHHRGTIGKIVDEDFVRAAIEKNRLLFMWKHLDDPELLREHLAACLRQSVDSWIMDQREELIWLALALEQSDEALAARATRPPSKIDFRTALKVSRPSSE